MLEILSVFPLFFKHPPRKFLLHILTRAWVWVQPSPWADLDNMDPGFSASCFPLSQSELCPGVCVTAGNGLWYHRLTVHLSSESRHHCDPNVKIYHWWWDEWCCLPHPSPSCLLFLFPATEVNGRRTGRSPYSCGTRSAVTGWETTSTSTCTSALHPVGMGGSTRRTKSPATVRNRPVYFWFAFFLGGSEWVFERGRRLQVSKSALWIESAGSHRTLALSHQAFEPHDFAH